MNNKYVYLAYWNNGLSYDDEQTVLVGVYSDPQEAAAGGLSYWENEAAYKQYGSYFYVETWEVDGAAQAIRIQIFMKKKEGL